MRRSVTSVNPLPVAPSSNRTTAARGSGRVRSLKDRGPALEVRSTLCHVQLPFAVTLTQCRDYTVVVPVGELDVATTPELREQLRSALDSGATPALDLRKVTFMDTSGVRVLIWADCESRIRHRRLQVVAGDSALPALRVCDGEQYLSWMSAEQLGPA